MNLPLWLRQAWPNVQKRAHVVDGYRALGLNRLLLADIALRGSVFDAHPAVANLYEAGVAEGRRQMALEIIRLCDADPALLLGVIERKSTGGKA